MPSIELPDGKKLKFKLFPSSNFILGIYDINFLYSE